jgi:hypothetical protein
VIGLIIFSSIIISFTRFLFCYWIDLVIGNSISLDCVVCGTSNLMFNCDSTSTPILQTASSDAVCWVIIWSSIIRSLFLFQRFDEICVGAYPSAYSILWWGPVTSDCNFTKTVSDNYTTCAYAYTCCSSDDCNNTTVITAPTTIATITTTETFENSAINPMPFVLLLSLVISCSFELQMN